MKTLVRLSFYTARQAQPQPVPHWKDSTIHPGPWKDGAYSSRCRHCKYTLVLDPSADQHLLHWVMLVGYAAFSQGLGFLVVGNYSHAYSPAMTAALQTQLPEAVDVRNPRANNTICSAFHSAKLFCICQIAAVCCSDHRPAEQEEIF